MLILETTYRCSVCGNPVIHLETGHESFLASPVVSSTDTFATETIVLARHYCTAWPKPGARVKTALRPDGQPL